MDNLFTKEQIEELGKISKLPEEEQKKVLPDFLKRLTPEQLDALKQTQPVQCLFCLISENKIKSKKIYEDKDLIAVLEINPANPGHTLVFTKKHYSILSQIDDVGQLFNLANKLSSILFESLNAKGTNILVSNGPEAGQTVQHASINIIPRFSKDKLNLDMERKKVSEEDLEKVLTQIKTTLPETFFNIKPKSEEEIKPKKQEEFLKVTKTSRLP